VTSLSNGNTYGYDANGNMTSRNVGGQSFTLNYDSENRLVTVTGAATASFSYDADGRQVIGTVNGVTTYYVGNHYEKKNNVVTKYYFAGATRLAMRTGDTLSFLLGDHIGSSSVRTNANGGLDASALYKAFGETRYTYGTLGTDYKFTGQREEISLGIYWFQSRWFDATLGRFTQPDSIVPTGTQGTQAWDRYAFVNNNPVRYNDPTGHQITGDKCGLDDCESWGGANLSIDSDNSKKAVKNEKKSSTEKQESCSSGTVWSNGQCVPLNKHDQPLSDFGYYIYGPWLNLEELYTFCVIPNLCWSPGAFINDIINPIPGLTIFHQDTRFVQLVIDISNDDGSYSPLQVAIFQQNKTWILGIPIPETAQIAPGNEYFTPPPFYYNNEVYIPNPK
jgi:RHS repeat-associated protein